MQPIELLLVAVTLVTLRCSSFSILCWSSAALEGDLKKKKKKRKGSRQYIHDQFNYHNSVRFASARSTILL